MDQPSLDDSRAKLCRAREHIDSLARLLDEHRKSRPYDTSLEGDLDTGEYVAIVRPHEPPKGVGLLIGDVAANLRGALDYLIYALAWLDSGSPQSDTQFPIADSAERFKSAQARRLKGVSATHIAAIEGLQPYNGGKWLARLRDLSNTDKHMHLSLVQPDAIGDIAARDDAHDTALEWEVPYPGALHVHVDFDVALYEAFPDGGGPVVWTLQVLESEVRTLIQTFEPDFEGA